MPPNKKPKLFFKYSLKKLFLTLGGISGIIIIFLAIVPIVQTERDRFEAQKANATQNSANATLQAVQSQSLEIQVTNQAVQSQNLEIQVTNQAIQLEILKQVSAPGPGSSESRVTSFNSPSTAQNGITRYNIPIENNPILGSYSAPITIVVFGDFECPYTSRWINDVLPKLMELYSGKIRIIFRDFPLVSIHPNAFVAAESAYCAGEQGSYWKYNKKLFSGVYGLNNLPYWKISGDLTLNQTEFLECLSGDRPIDKVQGDLDFAVNFGVMSTPTFFINGLLLVGSQPIDVFQSVIDKELAGEFPK